MSLSTRQRYGAFFIGAGIGCVLVTIYFSVRGMPHQPEPPPPGVIRRQVPGVMLEWMHDGKPISGNFILSQADSRQGGGLSTGRFTRSFVVAGLDPGAFIRVEEVSTLSEPDKVVDWKFMFADHVRAQLKPGADTRAMADAMAKFGWSFSGGKDKDGWVTITLKEHDAVSMTEAERQMQQWPQWVAKTEPDYLPAPTPFGGSGPF